jgi:hypothetical protein
MVTTHPVHPYPACRRILITLPTISKLREISASSGTAGDAAAPQRAWAPAKSWPDAAGAVSSLCGMLGRHISTQHIADAPMHSHQLQTWGYLTCRLNQVPSTSPLPSIHSQVSHMQMSDSVAFHCMCLQAWHAVWPRQPALPCAAGSTAAPLHLVQPTCPPTPVDRSVASLVGS